MKRARSNFKKDIFQYVLRDSERLAELESSHCELVAKARKMKEELRAKRAKSLTGKVKNAVRSGLDKFSTTSVGKIKRKSARQDDPTTTGLMSTSDSGSDGTDDD